MNRMLANRTHDRPEFERKVSELCDGCKVLYSNAEGSAPRQQKQAEEAMAKGADVLVVDLWTSTKRQRSCRRQTARRAGDLLRPLALQCSRRLLRRRQSEAIGEVQAQALSDKLRELGKREGPLALITTNTSGWSTSAPADLQLHRVEGRRRVPHAEAPERQFPCPSAKCAGRSRPSGPTDSGGLCR